MSVSQLSSLALSHLNASNQERTALRHLETAATARAAVEVDLLPLLGTRTVSIRTGDSAMLVWAEGGRIHSRVAEFVDATSEQPPAAEVKTETKRGPGRPRKDEAAKSETKAETPPPVEVKSEPKPEPVAEAKAPPAVETKAETPPAAETKPAKVETYTKDEVRSIARNESKRIGGSAPILEMCAGSIENVKPEDYATFVAKMRALPVIVKA